MKTFKNYDEIVAFCVGLRSSFEREEVKMFLGLRHVHQKYMRLLRQAGCVNFDGFIRRLEMCKPERYHTFVSGMRHVRTEKLALELGAPAVMALAVRGSRPTSKLCGRGS